MLIEIATHPATESLAIIAFVFYVTLAARGSIWCWASGFLTSFLYTFIFLGAHVTSQLFLNILYMLMSVWGWYNWTLSTSDSQISIYQFSTIKQQIAVLPLLLLAIAILMVLLPSIFFNVNPLLDASITVFSVYTTILTIYRRIESWIYWIALNSCNTYLFSQGELSQTAFLYLSMTLISAYGFFNWRKLQRRDVGGILPDRDRRLCNR